tara:strand:+ start:573 stop:764 length:192 start_codon:yes stop_codon:yes gene_type:complete
MSILGKFLGLTAKGKVLKTPSYMQSWKYPLIKQRKLRSEISKNFKNPKFRAKTKLVAYSKKFI